MVSSPTAVLGGLATIAENPEVVMSFSRMDAGSVVPAASSFDLSLPDHRFLLVLKTRLSRFDCDEKGLFVSYRFPYVPSLVQSFLILETRQIHPIGKRLRLLTITGAFHFARFLHFYATCSHPRLPLIGQSCLHQVLR